MKRMCFRIAKVNKKKLFRIASDLGVCDSNRIAHRGCIARFGPLSSSTITAVKEFVETEFETPKT